MIEGINRKMIIYIRIAWSLAGAAIMIFLIPLFLCYIIGIEFDIEKYAIFVGGTAGPLGALSGFLFVYIAFQGQQYQIEKQELQFRTQSFESSFFNLLHLHESIRNSLLDLDIKDAKSIFKAKMEDYAKTGSFETGELELLKTSNPPMHLSKSDVGVIYGHSFKQLHIPTVTFVKSIITILNHIHLSKISQQHGERYIDIVYNRLTSDEKFILAYFSLFDITETKEDELILLKLFVKKIPPYIMTYGGHHHKWLHE